MMQDCRVRPSSGCPQVSRHKFVQEYGVPYRDLRILDPLLPTPYPSSLFVRAKAIVVNFESLRLIICKNHVRAMLPSPQHPANWHFGITTYCYLQKGWSGASILICVYIYKWAAHAGFCFAITGRQYVEPGLLAEAISAIREAAFDTVARRTQRTGWAVSVQLFQVTLPSVRDSIQVSGYVQVHNLVDVALFMCASGS